MTAAAERAAARRLGLPSPSVWSLHDQDEATACTGCKAFYEGLVRRVRSVAGCPAHGGGER